MKKGDGTYHTHQPPLPSIHGSKHPLAHKGPQQPTRTAHTHHPRRHQDYRIHAECACYERSQVVEVAGDCYEAQGGGGAGGEEGGDEGVAATEAAEGEVGVPR